MILYHCYEINLKRFHIQNVILLDYATKTVTVYIVMRHAFSNHHIFKYPGPPPVRFDQSLIELVLGKNDYTSSTVFS